MAHTLTAFPEGPHEISWKHHIPMWAYPQLEYLRKRFPNQLIITRVERVPDADGLFVRAYSTSGSYYLRFMIYKKHMKSPEFVPRMFAE